MKKPDINFFLAIPLPDSVQTFLSGRASKLQKSYSFKTWAPLADYHITLIFLGKGISKCWDELEKELTPVIARYPAFRITLAGIGTFGKKQRPNVLWNGVTADEDLYRLHRDVHKKCSDFGLDLDERPFHPHITLARKWNHAEKLDPSRLHNVLVTGEDGCSWMADKVVLYRSSPNKVPKYRVVTDFPFGEK